MKTNYFSTKSLSVFSLIGLVGLLVTSCGSYQNSSYYDRDGIYTSSVRNNETQATAVSNQQYKDYFDSRIEEDSAQVFTDIDGYSSYQNEGDYATGYSAWGSNSDNVTVNVYDNSWGWNNWGWGWGSPYYGWGWNNWYGPGWGLGWGGWYGAGWYGGGWGWNNWYGYPNHGWGWNNHYYNNYAQSRGRRGESYNYNNGTRNYLSRPTNTSVRGNRNYNNSASVRRNMNGTSTRNANFSNRNTIRNTNFNTTRNTSTRNSNAIPVRNNNSNAVPNRNNNSNVAPSRNSTPTRSYSPAPTRSSGSSMGGGRSGGSSGGGGGRSSGGRR